MYCSALSLLLLLLLLACTRSKPGAWTSDDHYRVHLACVDTLHDVMAFDIPTADALCTCIVTERLQQRYTPYELDQRVTPALLQAMADSCNERIAPPQLSLSQGQGSRWTRSQKVNYLNACTSTLRRLGHLQADSTRNHAQLCACLASKLETQMAYAELAKLDSTTLTQLAAGCGVQLPRK